MLTAAVVGTDTAGTASLRASLEQTGLIHTVLEWIPALERHPVPGEVIPDVVLLDLPREPSVYFIFAAHLRRLRPTVRVMACAGASPSQDLLLQAMRSGVEEFIVKPVDAEALRTVLSRFAAERDDTGERSVEKLIVVAGSKGGVGTSTVAVNLGVQLAQATKKRVVLLDFARPLGHLSVLLDLKPRFSVRDAVENLDRLDSHFFSGLLTKHKTGLEILGGTSHAEEWQRLPIASLVRVVNVAQGAFDYLLMDGGVQDPSEWLPLLRTARVILLVAEAGLLSLWALERYLSASVALGLDPERIRIVINRWRREDDEALSNVEKKIKRTIYARLPNDYRQVSEAVTMGVPLAGNSGNPLVARYHELALDLAGLSTPRAEKRGALSSLFTGSR
jgi:pilus assembly protein CpaE